MIGMKTCKRCGADKPLEEFHSDRSRPDGKYAYCKECAKAYKRADHHKHRDGRVAVSRQYHADHREDLNARKRERLRSDPDYRDSIRQKDQARYQADPEQMKQRVAAWSKQNPDQVREYQKRSRANHPDTSRDSVAAMRARRAGVAVEPVKRSFVFERDKGICHVCGIPVDPKRWDIDHVIPIRDGGAHTHDNVAVSHPKCNRGRNSHR